MSSLDVHIARDGVGRVKAYYILLITVALNCSVKRTMSFAHEENKVGSKNYREGLPL